jgi:hypothetical protein
VLRAGFKLLYTHESHVFHHEGKSAEQEKPAWLRLVTLASLLHYLDGEGRPRRAALRRLFKLGYLAEVVRQTVESALKTVGYTLARSREAATKHRRRLARNLRLLAQAWRVARL